MLPADHRMRRSADFRRTVRHGVRSGRRTLVVHALRAEATEGSLVGFVVSKAVGTAVRRNRVRRRLRHLARARLSAEIEPALVVVRALPPAASAGAALSVDFEAAWTAAMRKLAQVPRSEPR